MSLRLAVQTKTTYQVRPRIPNRPGPDQLSSPYGAARPYDQTAGILAADNQAIKAQQQLLQNLHPKEHSFHASRNQAAIKARPRPRPRTEKTHNSQQTCNFTSMQAQLSELQKMF